MARLIGISVLSVALFCSLPLLQPTTAGIVKDIFQKITNTNNKTESIVKESAPICGSGAFSPPNEASLSPEIIFITNRPSRVVGGSSENHHSSGQHDSYGSEDREELRSNDGNEQKRRNPNSNSSSKPYPNSNTNSNSYSNPNTNSNSHSNSNYDHNSSSHSSSNHQHDQVSEVANEYTFHVENVTLRDLEERGFNRDAPVTFLMHGFTSGYPLQAWISAIVEAYTIDRQSGQGGGDSFKDQSNLQDSRPYSEERRRGSSSNSNVYHQTSSNNQQNHSNSHSSGGSKLDHNLFIINWNYAARGILYPRAVANIPIVASYATKFINEKLLDEARMDPNRIELIGHSLGAHLAGFIGKNTRQKLGRIYGLDPAGPCFGTLAGPLYPSSKRLAPSDAKDVVTIQTNSALLGIDKPLGRHSIFVEGGANQPGCKGGGALKSLHTLTWDGGDFDTVACSHSRAPNLLTYRYDQSDPEDSCQMVAYACKDWDSFLAGHCGVCQQDAASSEQSRPTSNRNGGPLQPVACRRFGLDWQYYKKGASNHGSSSYQSNGQQGSSSHGYGSSGYGQSSSSNGHGSSGYGHGSSSYDRDVGSSHRDNERYNGGSSSSQNGRDEFSSGGRRRENSNGRNKRAANSSSSDENSSRDRKRDDRDVESISMFIRTGDTQPYCTFHYQVVLELNEAFPSRGRPPMSIILQDTDSSGEGNRKSEQNSLSSDEFGKRFDDKTYTDLMTSNRKSKRIDHATLIMRNGLENGHRFFRNLHINYMSHSDPEVRRRLSSKLCPVKTEVDRRRDNKSNRFYFKPCDSSPGNNDQQDGYQKPYNGQNHRETNSESNQHGQGNSNNHGSSSYNGRDREVNHSYKNQTNHGSSSYWQ